MHQPQRFQVVGRRNDGARTIVLTGVSQSWAEQFRSILAPIGRYEEILVEAEEQPPKSAAEPASPNEPAIRTFVSQHDQFRTVICFLCQSPWEEQLVGISLADAETALGSLCPRCLSRPPCEAANWIRHYGERLRSTIDELRQSLQESSPQDRLPPLIRDFGARVERTKETTLRLKLAASLLRYGAAELRERLAQTREQLHDLCRTSKQLIATSQRSRDAAPRSSSDGTLLPRLSGIVECETIAADSLLSLAERMSYLEQWPTTIGEVIDAEQRRIRKRFGPLSEADLHRTVDSRYLMFLSRPV